MTRRPISPTTEQPAEHEKGETFEARLMEGAIADEAARPLEEMKEATPLVEKKDEHKRRDVTLAKLSAEEDWQGIVAPDPAFYFKDNG